MTPSQVQTLLADAKYAAWFTRWWEADFSVQGCNSKSIDWRLGRHTAHQTPFAGRDWGPGREPPHDPDGNLNESLISRGWYDWEMFFQRSRSMGITTYVLDGAWFKDLSFNGMGAPLTLRAASSFIAGRVNLSSNRSAAISFKSAYIGGGVALTEAELSDRAVFTKATIRGDVELRRIGGARVHFNRTFISGALRASENISDLDLSEAHIDDDLTSDSSVKKLDGYRAQFGGNVMINGASQARADISLHQAKITRDLVVSSAQLGILNLSRAEIGGTVRIMHGSVESLVAPRLEIDGDLTSAHAKIGHAKLHNLHLRGHFHFSSVDVDALDLNKSVIEREAHFDGCQFSAIEAFGVKFKQKAAFQRTRFSGAAQFNQSMFHGETSFRGSAFHGRTTFIKCRFLGSASFAAEQKDWPGAIDGGASFDFISFQASRFTASDDNIWCVDFDGRQFNSASVFDGCAFVGAAKFFEVAFHEDVSFRYTTFGPAPRPSLEDRISAFRRHAKIGTAIRATLNTWNKGQQHYEHAYRSLKMRMNEIGSAREERRFLALELRARRSRFDQEVKPLESLLSLAYDLTSQYGESIVRPLGTAAAATLIAASIYHLAAPSQIDWWVALEFAIRQIFKPFNVWAEGGSVIVAPAPANWMDMVLGQRPSGVTIPGWMKFVASLQSLLCLTLLFLSALAIRKRFRLD